MDTAELLSLHKRFTRQAQNLMERKNHDYAGGTGRTPFANFEMAHHLGLCSTAQGVLIRLSDKLSRLAMFEKNGALEVTDEQIEDTVLDIINYAVIYGALKQEEGAPGKHNLEEALDRARLAQPIFDFPAPCTKSIDPYGIPVGPKDHTEYVTPLNPHP